MIGLIPWTVCDLLLWVWTASRPGFSVYICISLLSDRCLPLQPLAGHVYSATAVERSQHPSNPENYCTQARGLLTPNLHYRDPRTEIQRKQNRYSQIYLFPFQIFPFLFLLFFVSVFVNSIKIFPLTVISVFVSVNHTVEHVTSMLSW